MTFISAVKSCLGRQYFSFRGRASRSEYWFFALFNLLATLTAVGIDIAIGDSPRRISALLIVFIVLLVPGFAVSVRRLHDINRSGWWLLISQVPLIGPVILIIWAIRPGNAGPNRFGPDPLRPPPS